MNLHADFSLRPFNTFGVDACAAHFAEITSVEELKTLLSDTRYRSMPKLILGGGSNILFTRDFDGLVIHHGIKGIQITEDDHERVLVKVGGGEIWHDFVLWCVEHGYTGSENLSLIPGTVGAAPVQNIGAYGVEVKDIFHKLDAVRLNDATLHTFSKEECQFGYRNSIFKQNAKNKFAIVSVSFRFNKKPEFHVQYGALQEELKVLAPKDLTVKAVSDAVIRIRRSKLPDPAVLGNAGSFFKNPEIKLSGYEDLKRTFPNIIAYKASDERMKLSAGWFIEQCGWKGKRVGQVGMHQHHALVLVNYGGATGQELLQHSINVQKSVKEKFGIDLEPEVRVV